MPEERVTCCRLEPLVVTVDGDASKAAASAATLPVRLPLNDDE